jgi:hypothetical protein
MRTDLRELLARIQAIEAKQEGTITGNDLDLPEQQTLDLE